MGDTANFGINPKPSNYSASIADTNTDTDTFSLKITDHWMILYFCLYWIDHDHDDNKKTGQTF